MRRVPAAPPEAPPVGKVRPLDERLRADPVFEELVVHVTRQESVVERGAHTLVVVTQGCPLAANAPRRENGRPHLARQTPHDAVGRVRGVVPEEMFPALGRRKDSPCLGAPITLEPKAELRERHAQIVAGHVSSPAPHRDASLGSARSAPSRGYLGTSCGTEPQSTSESVVCTRKCEAVVCRSAWNNSRG